jgi:hypothetical protein
MLNIKNILVNLRLFDGEGEGGQAGTESTTAATGSQQQGEAVVYGKEVETQPSNEQQTTENAPVTQETNYDFSKIPQEKRSEVFKQFKEAFKDEYTNEFNSHFDRRFKGHKETEGKVAQYEPIIDSLMKYHNVKTLDELNKVIETDVLTDLAEQEGFPSVEKYKEYIDAKRKGELLETKTKEEQAQKDHQDRINTWVDEGMELKKTYQDFDLSKEILNPDFAARLERGMSVTDAYTLTHLNDIVTNASKAAAQKAEENTVTAIKSKSQRIPENGTKQTPGIVRKTDPSKLSDKDLAEIARRVSRGEKITF